MVKGKTRTELVLDAVTILAEAFGRTATEVTVRAYELGLADISAAGLTIATQRALQTCKFMPSPAELRELSGASLRPEDRAAKAWSVFNDACRPPLWLNSSVDFDDPVLNATVRALGGWVAVSRLKNAHEGGGEYIQFFQPQFLKTYAALCRSGVSAEQAAYLPGRRRDCVGYGPENDPPVAVATGLPAMPGVKQATTIEHRPADLPRLELKRA